MGGLTAEDALKAYLQKKKSLYQLDLETKDRKPDIVPKAGDRVKIKSREWYEKWKDEEGRVSLTDCTCKFIPEMSKYCGKVLTVCGITGRLDHQRWRCNDREWYWVSEFFEEVYPQEGQTSSVLPRQVEWNLSQAQLDSLKMLTRISDQHSTQGIVSTKHLHFSPVAKEEPKLKQIKTTRLIKLNKV